MAGPSRERDPSMVDGDGERDEVLQTPEQRAESARVEDIFTARREARESFKVATEYETKRLSHRADPNMQAVSEAEVEQLTARNISRHVLAYVEEVMYYLETMSAGEFYWREVDLGSVDPQDTIDVERGDAAFQGFVGDGGTVEFTGLKDYVASGGEVSVRYWSYDDGGKHGLGDFPEKKTVTIAVPAEISRRAWQATNSFVESGMGLELEQKSSEVVNASLLSDGSTLNTNGTEK